ncbi:hypothetical protein AB0D10_00985 [Kitasatospora sp. NPDC048545]
MTKPQQPVSTAESPPKPDPGRWAPAAPGAVYRVVRRPAVQPGPR